MMRKVVICTFSIILAIVLQSQCITADDVDDVDDCFTLTAAFDYLDHVYFVDDEYYIDLGDKLNEIDDGNLLDTFGYGNGSLDAALVSADDNDLYFFEDDLVYDLTTDETSPIDTWGDFFHGGIGAASSLDGVNFYFKQCLYITNFMEEEQSLDSLDLPCDIDAAFNYGNRMYLIKRYEVWIMDHDWDVDGPYPLPSIVTLTTSRFCL